MERDSPEVSSFSSHRSFAKKEERIGTVPHTGYLKGGGKTKGIPVLWLRGEELNWEIKIKASYEHGRPKGIPSKLLLDVIVSGQKENY